METLLIVGSLWLLIAFVLVDIMQRAKFIRTDIDEDVWTSCMLEKEHEIKDKDSEIISLKKEVEKCHSTILYQANERNQMCENCTYRNLSSYKVSKSGKITEENAA